MTPDEHRAEAEHLLEMAANSHAHVLEDGDSEPDGALLAETQALATMAVAHALLAGPPPQTPTTVPPRHVPTNEVVDYPGDDEF